MRGDPFAPPFGPEAPSEDPFAADSPQGRGIPFDPFAPPTPLVRRTPRTATGNISPTISIQIEGDPNGKLTDIESFTLTDDIQQLADPWSCDIPDVDGRYTYLLDYLWFPVKIWVSDPRVKDGREIKWMEGVITDISHEITEDGTTIHLSGYDKGWYLGSGAPLWVDLRNASYGKLFQAFIKPDNNWGITKATSVYFNNRLRQDRLDAEIREARKQMAESAKAYEQSLSAAQEAAKAAGKPIPTRADLALQLTPPFFVKPPTIQTEPGEDCGSVMIRYAALARRFLGISVDGELQFFQPDYKQSPSYIFHNHRPSDTRHTRNNVLPGSKYDRAGSDLFNVVECITTCLVKDGTDLANENDPNEGKNLGQYVDFRTAGPDSFLPNNQQGPIGLPGSANRGKPVREIGKAPLRRLAFNYADKITLKGANDRAKWKWQQSLYASKTLTYPVAGISQQGPDGDWRIYCAGTMAEVYDSWRRIEYKMFVSRVQITRNSQGTTSVITLKLPDLLGA